MSPTPTQPHRRSWEARGINTIDAPRMPLSDSAPRMVGTDITIEDENESTTSSSDDSDVEEQYASDRAHAHLQESTGSRTAVPSSRSTFFNKLMRGASSSVPAAGIFGIQERRESAPKEEKKRIVTPTSAPRVRFAAAAKSPAGPGTTPLCQAAGTAVDAVAAGCSRLPALAQSCAQSCLSTMLAAIPIAILSYATITTYAVLIVEGTTMPRELVVSIQVASRPLSAAPSALPTAHHPTVGRHCPPPADQRAARSSAALLFGGVGHLPRDQVGVPPHRRLLRRLHLALLPGSRPPLTASHRLVAVWQRRSPLTSVTHRYTPLHTVPHRNRLAEAIPTRPPPDSIQPAAAPARRTSPLLAPRAAMGAVPWELAPSDVAAHVAGGSQVWVSQVYSNPAVANDEKLPTALVSMALMTILMSLVFTLVGSYRGADLIQYLPFPVTAGFLAAIGAAIMRSALNLTLDRSLDSLTSLFDATSQLPYQLSACLAIAISLLLLRRLDISFKMLISAPTGCRHVPSHAITCRRIPSTCRFIPFLASQSTNLLSQP